METPNVPQKEIIKGALLSIAKNVTANDRKEAMKELNVSKPTVNVYLRGNVMDIDKGMAMLQFFKGRVTARAEQLATMTGVQA